MKNVIPLEKEDPELGELLSEVTSYNAEKPMKDWIIVDFEKEVIYQKTIRHEKVGRNDPCPCGSKKKYKKCCGR
jgi:uncharacterized protein YecA (UPF0149 family)